MDTDVGGSVEAFLAGLGEEGGQSQNPTSGAKKKKKNKSKKTGSSTHQKEEKDEVSAKGKLIAQRLVR